MSDRFDAFVILAEMRSGSNYLQETLNRLSDVDVLGEIFNPTFLGAHNKTELFGIDMDARAKDPFTLLRAVIEQPGLPGFRYFHDHDPRVLDTILTEHRIGKVVLTRNPLDAYVSLKIASETGQWRLTNPKVAKSALATFDGPEFDNILAAQRTFRERLHRILQTTGQTAFWMNYDDIGDVDVMNGLARFLGSQDRLQGTDSKLKRQNPGEADSKVTNPEEMRAHLSSLDPFLLSRSVHLEPVRGPSVPTFQVAATSPLLHLPIPGGSAQAVTQWMTSLDGQPPQDGLSQKELRPWMRKRPGFVSFSVLRHPLARAFDAFRHVIEDKGPRANDIRRILANQHGVVLDGEEGQAFLGFLRFLKANLSGQSALPVSAVWASQSAVLAGMAQAVLPQRLIREQEAQTELDLLANRFEAAPVRLDLPRSDGLRRLVTGEIEKACADVYRRDFIAFGFGRWSASARS